VESELLEALKAYFGHYLDESSCYVRLDSYTDPIGLSITQIASSHADISFTLRVSRSDLLDSYKLPDLLAKTYISTSYRPHRTERFSDISTTDVVLRVSYVAPTVEAFVKALQAKVYEAYTSKFDQLIDDVLTVKPEDQNS
jgi:hypothetical protein